MTEIPEHLLLRTRAARAKIEAEVEAECDPTDPVHGVGYPPKNEVTNANYDVFESYYDGEHVWVGVRNDGGEGITAKYTPTEALQVLVTLQGALINALYDENNKQR